MEEQSNPFESPQLVGKTSVDDDADWALSPIGCLLSLAIFIIVLVPILLPMLGFLLFFFESGFIEGGMPRK